MLIQPRAPLRGVTIDSGTIGTSRKISSPMHAMYAGQAMKRSSRKCGTVMKIAALMPTPRKIACRIVVPEGLRSIVTASAMSIAYKPMSESPSEASSVTHPQWMIDRFLRREPVPP